VRCAILTDFPSRFATTKRVLLGDAKRPYDVERARLVRGAVVLKLSDVASRDEADRLRGQTLYVPDSEAVPLDEGSYFWYQIIGLRVLTADGEELGRIDEIIATGSNDVYVVRSGKQELLVPAIRDVVQRVDLERGIVTVELMEGLR
jgi:16S rRNA processing protein RimM